MYTPSLVLGAVELPSYLPFVGSLAPESLPMDFMARLKNTLFHFATHHKVFDG